MQANMIVNKKILKVAILSPRPLFRDSLREILRQRDCIQIVDRPFPLEVELEEAIAWIRKVEPDVVLYDADPAFSDPLEILREIKSSCTKVILVLDDPVDEFVVHCVRQGAEGYLLTSAKPAEFVKAVYATCAGELWLSRRLFAQVLNRDSAKLLRPISTGRLTRREQQIVELVSQGLSNRDVAEKLLISQTTVKAYLNDIFKKLGVHGRVQLLVHSVRGDRLPTQRESDRGAA